MGTRATRSDLGLDGGWETRHIPWLISTQRFPSPSGIVKTPREERRRVEHHRIVVIIVVFVAIATAGNALSSSEACLSLCGCLLVSTPLLIHVGGQSLARLPSVLPLTERAWCATSHFGERTRCLLGRTTLTSTRLIPPSHRRRDRAHPARNLGCFHSTRSPRASPPSSLRRRLSLPLRALHLDSLTLMRPLLGLNGSLQVSTSALRRTSSFRLNVGMPGPSTSM
ncbi:hypothetical protein C8R44DRAFT_351469 [Mycena epipterygia]|nr:hypothetical protein C8R44DRAFT_117126 [Mycena epipterygia]KAJ7100352.1 hypothetical protein C8R44DRAFT_351469 [Mycena epipterygia]